MQNYKRGMPQAGSRTNTQIPPKKNGSYRYSPVKDTHISVKYERISPIKPSSQPPHKIEAVSARKNIRARKSRTAIRDFLFGFTVGLVIFGIAAIIICSSLLKLI